MEQLARMGQAPEDWSVTDRVIDVLVECAWLVYAEGCVIQAVLAGIIAQLPAMP